MVISGIFLLFLRLKVLGNIDMTGFIRYNISNGERRLLLVSIEVMYMRLIMEKLEERSNSDAKASILISRVNGCNRLHQKFSNPLTRNRRTY